MNSAVTVIATIYELELSSGKLMEYLVQSGAHDTDRNLPSCGDRLAKGCNRTFEK